jgi:hypothetical protein
MSISGLVRCTVKVDGEAQHDETFPLNAASVEAVSYPGLIIAGQRVEVGFEFDPPLAHAVALDGAVGFSAKEIETLLAAMAGRFPSTLQEHRVGILRKLNALKAGT